MIVYGGQNPKETEEMVAIIVSLACVCCAMQVTE